MFDSLRNRSLPARSCSQSSDCVALAGRSHAFRRPAPSLSGRLPCASPVFVLKKIFIMATSSMGFRPRVDLSGMPEKIFGQHFKRWQQRMKVWFTMVGLFSLIESDPPVLDEKDPDSAKKIEEWKEKDRLGNGCILTALSNVLFDVYSSSTFKTTKALWDELDPKYNTEDQGLEKYSVGKTHLFDSLRNRSLPARSCSRSSACVALAGRSHAFRRPAPSLSGRLPCASPVTNALRESGLESSNLILGIDFTKSNEWTGLGSFSHYVYEFVGKHSFNGRSLHAIGNTPNPYEQAIAIIGKTLAPFDEDNLIPCFGFGDGWYSLFQKKKKNKDFAYPTTHDQGVFSFHSDHSPCHGFEEVLSCYKKIVPHLKLSGPTSFASIIEAAMDIVEKSQGQYHVLVIIADGQVTRSVDTGDGELSPQEEKTINAIVEASAYPLSIVLVGVGDGPWDDMSKFDDRIPARDFDNFQFVNFASIMSKNSSATEKEAAFALAALMEIPIQYRATLEFGILGLAALQRHFNLMLLFMHADHAMPPLPCLQHRHAPGKPKRLTPRPPPIPTARRQPTLTNAPRSSPQPNGEDQNQVCPICLTNAKNLAFGCGHMRMWAELVEVPHLSRGHYISTQIVLRASGGIIPYTTDTFTPAFSHTPPSCSTLLIPPPPPGLDHTSSLNFPPPSAASMAAQTSSCVSRIILSNRALNDDRCSSPIDAAAPSDSRRNVSGRSFSGVSFSMATAWNLTTSPPRRRRGNERGRGVREERQSPRRRGRRARGWRRGGGRLGAVAAGAGMAPAAGIAAASIGGWQGLLGFFDGGGWEWDRRQLYDITVKER
ncbi:hypothetical protein Taro_000544 [Colocasia esculenta]|uniref:Copine C-terminal domain-containing protein n=1 Tax=Colocasia esculenta TaxID=4460 RepID=A0A843T881_COLES|nr:hypothetical protein [Colocasia esculenta]